MSGLAALRHPLFSDVVMEHFCRPRNVGKLSSLHGEGWAGTPARGMSMRIQIQLADGHIANARFATFGCVPAIASGSLLTEWVKGRTLEEAEAFSARDLIEALDGLPSERRFCAEWAVDALRAALADATQRSQHSDESDAPPHQREAGGTP